MMGGSSNKQKINTTSLTESETVAVHDNMSSILWTRYFQEEQGYPMRPSIVHQGNQRAIRLETNGRGSSSKRTRHMNIRYFFIADVRERGCDIIKYCPTDAMIDDFFTKPLGGHKFRCFRNIIMNCERDDYGVVDVDTIMRDHYERVRDNRGVYDDEPMVSRTPETVGSQECVEPRSNHMWAAVRIAHKNTKSAHKKDKYITKGGKEYSAAMDKPLITREPRTWAQVVNE